VVRHHGTRFGVTSDRGRALKFHCQTAGATLTAQQPVNNVVRVTVQALAAVLGGCQSLHTNSFDEALGLPTEQSATLALRTQQIIASEAGVTDTVDPLGGSYAVESLTHQLEIEDGRRPIVGLNVHKSVNEPVPVMKIDPALEREQVERVQQCRANRDKSLADRAIEAVERRAREGQSVMPAIMEAVEARVTVGEISDALRRVFGEHVEIRTV
jgi:methylmalonyl-CoA mutase N-terminal domain/subunit